ncbi:MAG: arginyl-tRNA synthetase, arginyl-tRNA synthetase [Candidatus Peregrinibacteria bacterium GW2011_GWF2_38_29]|nr:MAG: arginyl-tRNA synthetase, arginyl-tRNA synthetase [Candidatus Peregrinibacteria bacterium GW2011_GWF2_38_29]HBB03070.1 arginine--tRNA ligase [Candidatus Peregrinibacteria bacterium]
MNFRINSQIGRVFPQYNLGVILLKGIKNEKIVSVSQQLLLGAIAEKKAVAKNGIENNPKIAIWRKYLSDFGADITKHIPLLERIFKSFSKSDVIFYSTLENLLNYASAKYEMPVWGIDTEELCGDLEILFASGTEPFVIRNSAKLFHAEQGEVVYKDRAGVIARMWNTYESERTAIMPFSKNVCVFVENAGALDMEKLRIATKEIAGVITKYCGGSAEIHILGDKMFEIDLGVTGKTGINDAQFTQDPKRAALKQKFAHGPIKPTARLWTIKHGQKTELTSRAKEIPAQEVTVEKPTKSVQPKPEKQEKPQAQKETPAKKTKEVKKSGTLLIKDKLFEIVKTAAQKSFSELPEVPNFTIEFPREAHFGDYSSNIALMLSKPLKIKPKDVYDGLMRHLERPHYVSEITFTEPGFINFTLNKSWIKDEFENVIAGKSPYGKIDNGQGENIVVDFSAPNIAKPLGVHHLLSTIIGQAIVNIHKFLGYNVIGINYIGDWGTQFGKLIVAYNLWGDKKKVAEEPISEMLKLYVRFHNEAENDSSLEDKARAEFKKLEEKDKDNMKIWEWFKELSLKDIQKTYDALTGIHFDYILGESYYNDKMDVVLEEGKSKGVFIIGEEGSYIVKYPNEELPPYLVQKSDGTTLYSTRDIASIKHRIATWHPTKLLYVVDKSQSLHFKQLFRAIDLLGWERPECTHVDFGRMDFKDEKMSTRKGNIILLDEVLKEAISRAKAIIEQKNPDLKEKEKDLIANMTGIGSIKYNILSQNRTTDIVFDWDKMLSFDSNSASYLQYTYTRAASIIKKYKDEFGSKKKKSSKSKSDVASQVSLFDAIAESENVSKSAPAELMDEKELLVARLLVKFPEHVVFAAKEYKPNIITNYLYDLAQNFNAFYHTTPVLQADNENQRDLRVKLTESVAKILHTGLSILGIECPEKM